MEEKIKAVLEAVKAVYGTEYAYDHFTTENAVDPPFFIYRKTGTNAFYADNKPLFTRDVYDIELYTGQGNGEEVNMITDLLNAKLAEQEINPKQNGPVWIESEDFYETIWEME